VRFRRQKRLSVNDVTDGRALSTCLVSVSRRPRIGQRYDPNSRLIALMGRPSAIGHITGQSVSRAHVCPAMTCKVSE